MGVSGLERIREGDGGEGEVQFSEDAVDGCAGAAGDREEEPLWLTG